MPRNRELGRAVLEACVGRSWAQAGAGARVAYAGHSADNLEVVVAVAPDKAPSIWWRWPMGTWRNLLASDDYNVVSRQILELLARDLVVLTRQLGGAR